MTFAQYAKLNPGIDELDLVEDLEELCDVSPEGFTDYCEALYDFYSRGLSKTNQLRPVVIAARKSYYAAKSKARKNKKWLIVVLVLVAIFITFFLYRKYKS